MEEDLDEEFMQELKASCCVEAKDNIENCESYILEYEKNHEQEQLDAVKRELHCLKGSSNAAGLETFSKVVHSAENYCVGNVDSGEVVSTILEMLDTLRDYISQVEGGDEDSAESMIRDKCSNLLN